MRTSSKALSTLVLSAVVIIFATAWVASETGFSPIADNQFIRDLKIKMEKFTEHVPQDRVYLQFDKTLYRPGETIWFGAYLVNATDMLPSQKSDLVHVQLINPKGGIDREITLLAKNGKAAGDFELMPELAGGLYKIKAYTKWQLNEPDTLCFQKEITVQDVVLPSLKMKLDYERKAYGEGDDVTAKLELATNENQPLSNHAFNYTVSIDGENYISKSSETGNDGIMYIRFALPRHLKSSDGLLNVMITHEGKTESISRSVPIVLNNISLSFYPEGGDLISGYESHIAFKALNELGKPADVEGEIKNSSGKLITTFASYYNGMGGFAFTPEAGESYTAYVTKPSKSETAYELPPALMTGYNMHIENNYDSRLTITIYAPRNGEVSVVAATRGNVTYTNAVPCTAGKNVVELSTKGFPMGVSQITLFDNSGIALCERLTFVNYTQRLNISVVADKEKYLPREKVKLTLSVKDEQGNPLAARLSMSVTNDALLTMADDKQGNILSEMLLQPDVRGKIEDASFYFSENIKAKKALEFLLMTNGWRRFTWKKILGDQLPILSYQGERAIVSGYVYDIATGEPMQNVTIRAGNKNYQTNGTGFYSIRGLDISKDAAIQFSAQGYDVSKQEVEFYGVYDVHMKPKGYNPPVVWQDAVVEMIAEERMGIREAVALEPARAEMRDQRRKIQNAPAQLKQMAGAKDEDKKFIAQGKKPRIAAMNEQAAVADVAFKFKNKALARKQVDMPALVKVEKLYRAREFAMPDYSKNSSTTIRSDFRSTIFWDGTLETDGSGKKTVEFYASDEITSFRATVEGLSITGMVGHAEKTIFTQLPFSLSAKLPLLLVSEDAVSIPVTIRNNTPRQLSVKLKVATTEILTPYTPIVNEAVVEPMSSQVVYYNYKTGYGNGTYDFALTGTAAGMTDAIQQKIKIEPKGFPVKLAFSSNEMHDKFKVSMGDVIPGSAEVTLTAFPNVVSDLLKGVDAILREPYGCFEQTSMSSYPNVLVMDYLKTSGQEDPKIMAKAEGLIDKGYKMLTKYEASQRGYEWFGQNPGHEALTAYGLMQFNDMKSVYKNIDQAMITRTANWLNSRKDGHGGFLRDAKALDSYGRASEDITNAYITYALAAAQTPNLQDEINHSYEKASQSGDPYMMALSANSLFDHNRDKRAERLVKELLAMQNDDGSWSGKSHSITYSTGKALQVETTSLVLMALIKSENAPVANINKGANFIIKSREGAGDFGNTQSTIMALKALTSFANFSKKTTESGTIEFYVDGELVSTKAYGAGCKEAIIMDGLSKYVASGTHHVEVRYSGCKNPLPYTLAVNYYTELPQSSKESKVNITSQYGARQLKVGETLRYTVTVRNKTNGGLPCTMALISIPAGFTFQPWQLKEMSDKKVFDYYEIRDNTLMAYYRQMKPSQEQLLAFDLKAEIPGTYEAPASAAYLYYTNEYKDWCRTAKVTIAK